MSLQYARKDQDNKMGYVKRLTPTSVLRSLHCARVLFPDAEHIRDAYVDASNQNMLSPSKSSMPGSFTLRHTR